MKTLEKPRDIGSSGRRKHGLRLYVTGRKEERLILHLGFDKSLLNNF